MHEWALAEAVIETVLNYAKKNRARRILSVKVKVGKLQSIDMEIFKYAISELAKTSLLKDTHFEFIEEDALFKCNLCGHEWKLNEIKIDKDTLESIHFLPEVAHVFIKCPKCGSPDYNIIKGRGVFIESINIEVDNHGS